MRNRLPLPPLDLASALLHALLTHAIPARQHRDPVRLVARQQNLAACAHFAGAAQDVEDVASGRTTTYTIVGPTEADIKTGKLSAESPVARAVLGAAPGDTVSVETPTGARDLRIAKLH